MKKAGALSTSAICAALLSLALVMPVWAQEVSITLFHMNDTHGRALPGNNIIGVDTIAAIHAATENSLLIDAGDTFHGLPFANLNQGADIVELMNAAGYDLFTPGNHDFNFGYIRLLELNEMADFEFVASNVYIGGELAFSPISIREIEGVRLGFFGLTTPDTAFLTAPDNVADAYFSAVNTAAQAAVAQLQEEGVDMIIAIAHLGDGFEGPNRSGSLAQAIDGIDLIIDGHSHTLYEEGIWVENTLIVSVEDHGQFVGLVELSFYNGELQSQEASIIDVETARAYFEPMPEVSAIIEQILEAQSEELATVVASLQYTLYEYNIRTQEMPLGNMIADATRLATGADIAFENGGGMRDILAAGEVTRGDVIAVLPFGNYVHVLEISPAQLREALENGVSHMPEPSGRFPQISGFSFTFDVESPVGSRVKSIVFQGEELDLEDTYMTITMAVNNFLATGGDEYSVFVDLPLVHIFPSVEEIVAEFMATTENIYTEAEGRINQVLYNVIPAAYAPYAEEEQAETPYQDAVTMYIYTEIYEETTVPAQEAGGYDALIVSAETAEPAPWWSTPSQPWWESTQPWWHRPHPLVAN